MKIEIPLIFWHGNRDRIMSIDFYPNSNYLITCGAEIEDKMWIKLWEIEEQDISDLPAINTEINPFKINKNNPFIQDKENSMNLEDFTAIQNQSKIRPKFVYDISGAHTATVNIVRFSPNGMYLATGGDDSAIVIWIQKSRPVEFGSTLEKISWSNHKILRGHLSDIYDLSWSPDSKYLISGSVDNSAIIWNVEKAKGIQKFNDHNHFVQGVSWDPKNKYVITQSSDKSTRIYKNAEMKQEVKFYFQNQIKRYNTTEFSNVNQPIAKENYAEDKMLVDKEINNQKKNQMNNYQHYFADETQCPSFVRRHSWSPDGSICLLVAGVYKEDDGELENVVWGMSRKDMSKPCFYLPTLDKSATCVRFCPIIFEKTNEENSDSVELIELPYKMVFAVGTLDSLFIYDTQSTIPRYIITNIHYQPITDLAWKGSSILAASSSDGYITFCHFEKDELGKFAEIEKLPEKVAQSFSQYLSIDLNKNILQTQNVTNMIKINKKKNAKNEENITMNNPNVESNEDTNNKVLSHSNSILSNSNNNAHINIDDRKISNDNMNVITEQANNLITNPNAINSNQKNEKSSITSTNNEGQQQGVKRRIVPTFIK